MCGWIAASRARRDEPEEDEPTMPANRSFGRKAGLALSTSILAAACGGASATGTATATAPVSASVSAPVSASVSASVSAPVSALLSRATAARGRKQAIDVQLFVLDQALRSVSAERVSKLGERRDALVDEAGRALAEEIEALERVVEAPAPEGVDLAEVLADLARALEQAGRSADAAARYEALISRFPASPYALRAHLSLGSLAFAEERLEDVITHCDAVLAGEGREGRIEALYLQSWALRGLADAGKEDARRKAEEALIGITHIEPQSEREAELVEAAKREIGGMKKKNVGKMML
jgi:tetratricopeptide (TPR) repeat protein